jgi:hypothetical protein
VIAHMAPAPSRDSVARQRGLRLHITPNYHVGCIGASATPRLQAQPHTLYRCEVEFVVIVRIPVQAFPSPHTMLS